MKAQFAAVMFALTTGCVATAGPGYVGVQPVTPVVTATVDVGTPAPVDPVAIEEAPPPVDDASYDDDLYEGEPDLVEYEGNANIRIVYGATDPVFWSDGFYWRYGDDGTWYRSSVHSGGWSVYGDVPVHIRTIDRPVRFRQYKPATYRPRARKVGGRPAHTRPSYQRNYDRRPDRRPAVRQPDRRDNRPDARRPDNRPAYKDNRPDARPRPEARPQPKDNRPDARPRPEVRPQPRDNRPDARPRPEARPQPKAQPTYKKEEPKKAPPPAPKKDPPKREKEDKKKDKRR